ncbi:MAG: hypothetical protein ACXVA9_04875 [Bdellovibrionales bacterium]
MPELFPRYFNPEELGKSLREVSTDVVKTSRRDVISRWFHSAKDADLFIWMDLKRNIIKQQLSFYGQVVEWNVIEGVKTGHVVVEENQGREQGSEFLNFDNVPQMTAIDQAISLLNHVPALQDVERKALAENFRRIGASQNMPAEELIARFGEFLGRPSIKEPRHSAWNRLVARLSRWFKA